MTESAASKTTESANPPRRARVALLGEFSAGKSTLINLITGGKRLRTQVTATQMPAIWMSHGEEEAYLVDLEGNETPVDLENLKDVSTSDVAYIRVFMKTPVLTLCDLIDTPGNSDPNIAAIAWERIAEIADIAVWCSPSTQAWRQSEKAAWSEVPQRVRDNSILLLTRADKLLTEEDRSKVLRRVQHDAGHLFTKIHMASLLSFADIHEPLRDLIELCRGIEVADNTDAADGAKVLSGMFRSHDSKPESSAPISEDEAEQAAIDAILADAALDNEVEPAMTELPTKSVTPGFATALWLELTSGLAQNDPAALDRTFRKFLSTLDAEVASLREDAPVKIAS